MSLPPPATAGPLPSTAVSLSKLAATPHFETSYGHAYGYSSRELGSKAAHFEKTWNLQYPNVERVRRQNVSNLGYDKLGLGRLYDRSSHVQNQTQEETGLLGHPNIDSYEKLYAQGKYNSYASVPRADDPAAYACEQYSGVEPYSSKSGHPAFVKGRPASQGRTRRQLAMPPVRWSSQRHMERGQDGDIVNPKMTMYDSTYTESFCRADRLDTSQAMLPHNARVEGHGSYHPRSLLPLSKNLEEQQSRVPTERHITARSLRDQPFRFGRTVVTFSDKQREGNWDLSGFDMRDHIPQYRRARHATPNKDLTNLGFRTGGPYHTSKVEQFWSKPHMKEDTFNGFESRMGEAVLDGEGPVTRNYAATLPAQRGHALLQIA